MSLSSASRIMKRKAPWSERVVQLALYVVISSFILHYASGYIRDWLDNIGIAIPGDFVVNMVAIATGMFVTTVLLFFMRRSYSKGGVVSD